MERPLRIIATEEGFSTRQLNAAVANFMASRAEEEPGLAHLRRHYTPRHADTGWAEALLDLGERRIRDMDAAEIDVQILLPSSPGVQVLDTVEAVEAARLVNDDAAEAMRRHPGRLYGLACIAAQDPAAAAAEFRRAVSELGFKGAMINSNTHGKFLDEPFAAPILEAAVELDAPIYIHPREPGAAMVTPYLPYSLQGAIWGYAAEAGLHAVRLIMSGTFDRYPTLRIVLGHLGEGIPFFLDRLDVRYSLEHAPLRPALAKPPSAYFHDNFVVTTSGMNWSPAVRFCQQVLGPDKVLFAADYPFEDEVDAVARIRAIEMSDADRALLFHGNAERVFKL
jgi:5-carboxyvanillate decarboxylase